MSRRVRLVALAALVLSAAVAIAACGRKGPLYRPEDAKRPAQQNFAPGK